jgi:cation diffusion facilitator CzcD-associated flavoprotein CzcO
VRHEGNIRKAAESRHDKKGNIMASNGYDVITVGGGLGGAALAKAMSEHGARVLVLEREKQLQGPYPWS